MYWVLLRDLTNLVRGVCERLTAIVMRTMTWQSGRSDAMAKEVKEEGHGEIVKGKGEGGTKKKVAGEKVQDGRWERTAGRGKVRGSRCEGEGVRGKMLERRRD